MNIIPIRMMPFRSGRGEIPAVGITKLGALKRRKRMGLNATTPGTGSVGKFSPAWTLKGIRSAWNGMKVKSITGNLMGNTTGIMNRKTKTKTKTASLIIMAALSLGGIRPTRGWYSAVN